MNYKGKRKFRIRYSDIHSEAYHKDYVAYLYQQNKDLTNQLAEARAAILFLAKWYDGPAEGVCDERGKAALQLAERLQVEVKHEQSNPKTDRPTVQSPSPTG